MFQAKFSTYNGKDLNRLTVLGLSSSLYHSLFLSSSPLSLQTKRKRTCTDERDEPMQHGHEYLILYQSVCAFFMPINNKKATESFLSNATTSPECVTTA